MSAGPGPFAHEIEIGPDAPKLAPKAAGYFLVVAAVTTALERARYGRALPRTNPPPAAAIDAATVTLASTARLIFAP